MRELPPVLLRAESLPSLPAVALEVLRLARDEDASLDELAACLSRDPALAARLLKLANSPLFGGGKPVTTLQRATLMLGTKTVKLMALSFSLAGALPKKGRQGSLDFAEYWRRSLVNAIAARALARLLRVPRADEAFLCGLFAHFGRLVLARALPEEYEAVLAEGRGWPALELEEARLGFRSTDACARLLASWDLPELIHVSVGAWSRADEREALADADARELARLLELAHLAETVLCSAEKGAALAALQERMRARGFGEGEVEALLVGLEGGIRETAELLSIQLAGATSHEDLLEQARMQMVDVSLGTAADLALAERRNRELEGEKRALESRATTDKLTGLANRATLDEFLEREARARAGGSRPRALGVLMLDVDHFKRFNDTHGHPVGDEVLRRIGALLARMTRKGDLAARYGGEEFAVVFPETTPAGLASAGERLREAIEQESIVVDGRRLSVTASLGGACAARLASPADAKRLVELADRQLYAAKSAGRNRCAVHQGERLSA